MVIFRMWQCGAVAVIAAMFVGMVVSSGSAQTPTPSGKDLDPKVLAYKLPDQIPWKDDPIGAKMAVLAGDPSKPGLVRRADEVDSESHEPSALAPE
jgi:hypothetical protein